MTNSATLSTFALSTAALSVTLGTLLSSSASADVFGFPPTSLQNGIMQGMPGFPPFLNPGGSLTGIPSPVTTPGFPPSPIPTVSSAVPTVNLQAASQALPLNYTLYGITIRSIEGSSTGGDGFFVSCDTSEIAIGAFCEERRSLGNANALLTGGVATYNSAACIWKNPGVYRVSASCLAFKAISGDSSAGNYKPLDPLR